MKIGETSGMSGTGETSGTGNGKGVQGLRGIGVEGYRGRGIKGCRCKGGQGTVRGPKFEVIGTSNPELRTQSFSFLVASRE
jgi:hypothetical protein